MTASENTYENPKAYGPIYLPSGGTPVGKFEFLVTKQSGDGAEIGTFVRADTEEGEIIGVITDMKTVGGYRDPIARESEFTEAASKVSDTAMVAQAQVFYSPKMRSVRPGIVNPASISDIAKATRSDKLEWPIPAGLIPVPGGDYACVMFDGDNLLGPESAHLCIGGLSGQAAKTSYAGFLLKNSLEYGKKFNTSVAALVINVKGDDLVNLDSPPAPGYELTAADLAMYEAMGVSPTPFDDVKVYSPRLPAGLLRRDGPLTNSSNPKAIPFFWDLDMVWNYLDYFFPWMYEDEKLMSFFADFEKLVLRPNKKDRNSSWGNDKVDTFDKFDDWIGRIIAQGEEDGTSVPWRSHHVATLSKIRRMIGALPNRCNGLLAGGSADHITDDIPVNDWKAGHVMVVDIANLTSDIQAVVIARTCERLLSHAQKGELGVDHLIIFLDELNQFAPANGSDGAIKKILRKIASQGRYANISLWGAAQKLSKIDEMVRDNAATRALGISADGELSSGIYGKLSGGISEKIATLDKGSMALWHATFRSALIIKFPRPAWQTGRSGKKPPALSQLLGMPDAAVKKITSGLSEAEIDAVVSTATSVEEAKEQLYKRRTPNRDDIGLAVPKGSSLDLDDIFKIE